MRTLRAPVDRDRLRAVLGEELAGFAEVIPEAMAHELLRGDQGFISSYQLSEALLSRFHLEMREWTTPDVLRTLAPRAPLARNRMQSIAGSLAPVTSRAHPAFCYYPYIPFRHVAIGGDAAPLIVAVHGSSRNPKDLRDAYAAFAERHGCFVLAPLFPLDLADPVPDEAYKQLIGRDTRYDHVLWAMVDELAALTSTQFTKILIFGFSGGAQFAQRLLYVDPDRLDAVSLGAPSYVTLPDDHLDWWVGTRNFEILFARPLDLHAVRRTPIQLLCGTEDDLDCDIYRPEEIGIDITDYEAYGRNRPQRLAVLRDAYARHGIECETELVGGAGHAFGPLLEASKPFFDRILHAP